MSENAPEPYAGPARVGARYVSDEPGEVSLPGFLNAVPSIVGPGDEFSFEGSQAVELFRSPRFEEATLPEPVTEEPPAASPNEKLTKAELGEKLGIPVDVVEDTLKDDLVAQADELDAWVAPVFVPTPEPSGSDSPIDNPEGS